MPVVTKAELEDLITSTALADSTRNSEIGAKVLAALQANDLIVVPAEETEAMLDAAIMAEAAGDDSWAAKLRASPLLPR